ALQAADDFVKGTKQRLKKNGVLDDTYLIYFIDNGFDTGHQRLQPGKHCPIVDFYLDGQAITMNGHKIGSEHWDHTQIEHWGDAGFDGRFEKQRPPNITCKAIRVIAKEYKLHYSVWCSNGHELYDMNTDKGQTTNLYNSDPAKVFPYGLGPRPEALKQLQARLDTLLLVMNDCKGLTCVKPWQALHPKCDFESLTDVLQGKFDGFLCEAAGGSGF
ncbi:MAG: hypothetical protein Q9192_008702, partial [Flavoplaca navasiana]